MYEAPELLKKSFTCPHCNVLSMIYWDQKCMLDYGNGLIITSQGSPDQNNFIAIATCVTCSGYQVWHNEQMVFPVESSISMPNQDMPDVVQDLYMEARAVHSTSFKASAALLRLALQHLCKHLGGEGKNINKDIGLLVQNGLDVRIQQSLDIIRVTGNNAVHPGELDLDDQPEISIRLFNLLNIVVNSMITQPKNIESWYEDLPDRALDGIDRRDAD